MTKFFSVRVCKFFIFSTLFTVIYLHIYLFLILLFSRNFSSMKLRFRKQCMYYCKIQPNPHLHFEYVIKPILCWHTCITRRNTLFTRSSFSWTKLNSWQGSRVKRKSSILNTVTIINVQGWSCQRRIRIPVKSTTMTASDQKLWRPRRWGRGSK